MPIDQKNSPAAVANAAALTMEDVAKRSPSDCDFGVSALSVLPIVLEVSVLRSKVDAMNNLVVVVDEEGDHFDKGIHAKAVVPNSKRGNKSVNAARVGMERGISMATINESRQYSVHIVSRSETKQRRTKLGSRHSSVWSHFSSAMIGCTTSAIGSTTYLHE
jgi:hypothetical protein